MGSLHVASVRPGGAPETPPGAFPTSQSGDGGEATQPVAPAPGRVVFGDWRRGFGNLLIIDHGDGWLTVYGHNQSLRRHVGDMIKSGETIARAGSRDDNRGTG